MTSRAQIRSLLLRSRREADGHMEAIRTQVPLTKDFFCSHLRQYVLAKYLLTEEEAALTGSFDGLVELSLSKSMQISPELVAQFDTARSCDGTTSAMAKKVLLFMAIQRALEVELPAQASARVKTLDDLAALAWDTLVQAPGWQDRLEH